MKNGKLATPYTRIQYTKSGPQIRAVPTKLDYFPSIGIKS